MEAMDAPAEGAAGAAPGTNAESVEAQQPQLQGHESAQQPAAGRAKAKQKTPEQRAVLEKAFAGVPPRPTLCTAHTASCQPVHTSLAGVPRVRRLRHHPTRFIMCSRSLWHQREGVWDRASLHNRVEPRESAMQSV